MKWVDLMKHQIHFEIVDIKTQIETIILLNELSNQGSFHLYKCNTNESFSS